MILDADKPNKSWVQNVLNHASKGHLLKTFEIKLLLHLVQFSLIN